MAVVDSAGDVPSSRRRVGATVGAEALAPRGGARRTGHESPRRPLFARPHAGAATRTADAPGAWSVIEDRTAGGREERLGDVQSLDRPRGGATPSQARRLGYRAGSSRPTGDVTAAEL